MGGRLAKAGPLALAMAVGGAVAAFAAPAGAPAADPPAVTCALQLPAQPLTAQGLATPFKLVGVNGQTCHEANAGTAAFVQGLILDPATDKLYVYDPLVIDAGTKPAVQPTLPTLPANAIVALWFGFNGDVLTLRGQGAAAADCVNGIQDSPFGQFSYCNAPALFSAATAAIAAGKITVPPLGTAADGQSCPTTRDFGIVDQDQSDNVTSTYLALPNGRTAQNNQTAVKALAGKSATVLANGSDNLLLDHFVDPALGCSPWTAPDLGNGGFQATSLGLNELQAAADQKAPIAIVPLNDPMVLDNDGAVNQQKADLYRAGVDMAPVAQVPGSPTDYCSNLRTIGVQRTKLDRSLTDTVVSPDTGAASNLFAFLAMRLQQSYVNLGCQDLLNKPNPVHLKTNADGLVTDASFGGVGGGTASASPSVSASATVASASPSASASASSSTVAASASASPSASAVSTSKAPVTAVSTPPVSVSTSPAASQSTPATGSDDTSTAQASKAAAPGGNASASAAASASVKASTQAAAPSGSASAVLGVGSGNVTGFDNGGTSSGAGAGTGAQSAGKPAPVSTTAINVAGFEHTYTSAGANNPNSALAGQDPAATAAGFSMMSSRVFWALGGALVVLLLSLGYQRRPKQRKQSRRGVSSKS